MNFFLNLFQLIYVLKNSSKLSDTETSENKYRKILIEYFSKNEIVINFVISLSINKCWR